MALLFSFIIVILFFLAMVNSVSISGRSLFEAVSFHFRVGVVGGKLMLLHVAFAAGVVNFSSPAGVIVVVAVRLGDRSTSNTVHSLTRMPCCVKCLAKPDVDPPLADINFAHIKHFPTSFGSLLKCSHTFERFPRSIVYLLFVCCLLPGMNPPSPNT